MDYLKKIEEALIEVHAAFKDAYNKGIEDGKKEVNNNLLTLQERYNAQDSLLASVLETNQTLCKRLKEQEQALSQLKAKEA